MTVFTIWPDDVEWRRVSPRLFWLELVDYLICLAVVGGDLPGRCWLIFDFWSDLAHRRR